MLPRGDSPPSGLWPSGNAALRLVDAGIAGRWGALKLLQEEHPAPEMTSAQGMHDDGSPMHREKDRNEELAGFMDFLYGVDESGRLLSRHKGEKEKATA